MKGRRAPGRPRRGWRRGCSGRVTVRSTAHHPERIGIEIEVIVESGIERVRPIGTPRQLPHVPAHVGQAEGALRALEAADRPRARASVVRPVRLWASLPHGKMSTVRPPRRLLPLRLARKGDAPADRGADGSSCGGVCGLLRNLASSHRQYASASGHDTLPTGWSGAPVSRAAAAKREPWSPCRESPRRTRGTGRR